MKRALGSFVAVLVILSIATPNLRTFVLAEPDDFAGGDGSEGNPYQITDWNHLNNVRDYLGDHFILMNDLDSDTDGYGVLAGPSANGGEGWQPIGDAWDKFTGAFDGQGYEIRDLTIDRPDDDYVGLFGNVSGTVNAVGVVDAEITGYFAAGGLVGGNEGTVSGSYATGSVDGYDKVGGLVGYNWGTTSKCYATSNVAGYSFVGGLVGENVDVVSSCYATGGVMGYSYVGGLVGVNSSLVSNCYATGDVNGDNNVGGLIGWNDIIVNKCYATGDVDGSSMFGGLVGQNTGTVTDSFWDTQTSGVATSDGGTGKSTGEMLCLDTFTDTATLGLDEAWEILSVAHGELNPLAVWNIVDGRSYPFFGWYPMRFELKVGWNMVSVPRELPPPINTVAWVFKGEIVAIYAWNPTTKSYVVPATVEPNCGYWVAVMEDKTIAYLMTA